MSESVPSPVPPWFKHATLYVIGSVVATLAGLWVIGRLRTVLIMLLVALFVSFALEPAVQFLALRGWRRGVATGVVFLAAVALVVGFMAALAPLLISQATSIVGSLSTDIVRMEEFIGRFAPISSLDPKLLQESVNIQKLLQQYGSGALSNVFGIGSAVFGFLFQFVTIGFFAFYMTADGPRMRRAIAGVFPPRRQREILTIWEVAIQKTGAYVYTRLLLATVAGAVTTITLLILGVPNALALGLWEGAFSQFVPVVGTYIAMFLPFLVALGVSPAAAVIVILVMAGYQQFENLIVAPRISARVMEMHPAVALGSVIAGASLLGALGMILALPVAAIIQALISTSLLRHELVESQLLTVRKRRTGRWWRQTREGPGEEAEAPSGP